MFIKVFRKDYGMDLEKEFNNWICNTACDGKLVEVIKMVQSEGNDYITLTVFYKYNKVV